MWRYGLTEYSTLFATGQDTNMSCEKEIGDCFVDSQITSYQVSFRLSIFIVSNGRSSVLLSGLRGNSWRSAR